MQIIDREEQDGDLRMIEIKLLIYPPTGKYDICYVHFKHDIVSEFKLSPYPKRHNLETWSSVT